MSVLIKGIKVHRGRCWECPCLDGEYGDCNVLEKDVHDIEYEECPIIEIPDHGDLIDESETVEAQYYDDEHEEWSIKTKTVGDVLAEICEVPPKVVLPAERSVSPCDNCDERSDAGCSWCKRFERSEE